ncbi:hypothetical protein [Corynebacterium flavescens]|uniref:hypothetical protein n=1 Tax=Corynebacterium flavescens TaxID=28028 RepID=UPI002649D751|nr:hypothetical protein [Corynebacterium flavescens]MDN6227263.1 hypothetical protein [Corynebacterium flavescens]
MSLESKRRSRHVRRTRLVVMLSRSYRGREANERAEGCWSRYEFHSCVYGAQDDFKELVEFKTDWASTYTQRFKANFLHERIWAPFLPYAEAADDISIQDDEPHRTLSIGTGINLRVKRHTDRDRISTYTTKGAKDFYGIGEQIPIDGLERVGLAIGYRWDPEVDEVIAPVISLQDLKNRKLLWSVELLQDTAQLDSKIIYREIEEPDAPQIDISDEFRRQADLKKEGEGEG